MNARKILLSAALGLVGLHVARPAGADTPVGTVSGSGHEVIKRPPELLRMQIELSAKGKTLSDALKKLEARRESALGHLAKIGGEKDATKIGDVHMDASTSDRQRQMEMMVRQRMRQAGKKSKKPAEQPLTVSCLLTCEWKLKGRSAEELLVESHAIEEKARAADLAGLKAEEKSPEEEELAEEMGDDNFAVMYGGGGDDEMKPGEPIFVYVGKISPEDRTQALAAAFAKARQEAEQLSKAAGAELGPLQSLSEGGGMGGSPQIYGYTDFYSSSRSQVVMRAMAAQGAGRSRPERSPRCPARRRQPGGQRHGLVPVEGGEIVPFRRSPGGRQNQSELHRGVTAGDTNPKRKRGTQDAVPSLALRVGVRPANLPNAKRFSPGGRCVRPRSPGSLFRGRRSAACRGRRNGKSASR